MADYFEEMGRRPLEDGETPNHFHHFSIFMRDFGITELRENKELPPPTSKEFLQNLKKKMIKGAGNECPVCLKVSADEEVVLTLPCKHTFHSECILPWLEKTSTCPSCRYELPTDDERYEEYKREKLRAKEREYNLKVLHDSLFT